MGLVYLRPGADVFAPGCNATSFGMVIYQVDKYLIHRTYGNFEKIVGKARCWLKIVKTCDLSILSPLKTLIGKAT